MATPQEVANVVVFLSSSATSFITGTNPVVSGALTRGVQLKPARMNLASACRNR